METQQIESLTRVLARAYLMINDKVIDDKTPIVVSNGTMFGKASVLNDIEVELKKLGAIK